MKKRSSFVSNSSSTSFTITYYDGVEQTLAALRKKLSGKPLVIPDTMGGTTCFGWGPEECTLVNDRVNFAALQAYQPRNEKFVDILKNVLCTEVGVVDVDMRISVEANDDHYGYVDHQSSASEGSNVDIFDSYDGLVGFLFGNGSKVVLDNDNQ